MLAQDNLTQLAATPELNDRELETSFVHLMQMPDVHVCHRDIAKFKILLPSSSLANPQTAPGPKHLQVFFLRHCREGGAREGTIAPNFWDQNKTYIVKK